MIKVDKKPKRVSLLALPESTGTPVHGLYETLVLLEAVAADESGAPSKLFDVEIVGPERGVFPSACGLPLEIQRSIEEVEQTDIVISASMLLQNQEWVVGRYPETVDWLRRMHAQGADLCSACAGALLLAETGLLDGLETTTHWAFAPTFRRNFPDIRLRVEEVLIVAGQREEFVMAGAASSWQDLILYLISRHASPSAAHAIGKFLLYQWDTRTQVPFLTFAPPGDHGDAIIREVEGHLPEYFAEPFAVEEMIRRSGLPPSSFKRRFRNATGYSPLQYVQHLRVEEAKQLLEGTDIPIDEISWTVGYEEPAFFRRLFKRVTTMTPGEYRRKFRLPAAAPPEAALARR